MNYSQQPPTFHEILIPQRRKSPGRSWLFTGWMIFLAYLPLPFGSNRPLIWAINAIIVAIFLLLVYWQALRAGRVSEVAQLTKVVFRLIAASIIIVMVVQAFVGLPAPYADSIWSEASRILAEPLASRISPDPWASILSALRMATYFAVFAVSLELLVKENRARRLLRAVVYITTAYAIYGLLMQASKASKILWIDKWAYLDSLTATFVNRNTAAVFLGIGAIAAIVSIAEKSARLAEADTWTGGVSKAKKIDRWLHGNGMFVASFVILLSALVSTGSRAGFAFTLVACLVTLALLARIGLVSGRRVLGASVLLLIFSGLTLALGSGNILSRILNDNGSALSRGILNRITASMIMDHPYAGIGAGAYPSVFPAYRPAGESIFVSWYQAHNIYLEAISELGFPAGILVIVMIAMLVLRCLRGVRSDNRRWPFALFAVATWTLVGLQGLVDFALQTQSIAILAISILAMGLPLNVENATMSGSLQSGPGGIDPRASATRRGPKNR